MPFIAKSDTSKALALDNRQQIQRCSCALTTDRSMVRLNRIELLRAPCSPACRAPKDPARANSKQRAIQTLIFNHQSASLQPRGCLFSRATISFAPSHET